MSWRWPRWPSGACAGYPWCIPQPVRELRDLTSYRRGLIRERTSEKQRVEELEDQVKLSSVASNIFGVSGRQMLAAMLAGQRDPQVLARIGQVTARIEDQVAPIDRSSAGKTKAVPLERETPGWLPPLARSSPAAARTDTFLGERYHHIVRRRGKRCAMVAVGNPVVAIVWNLLPDPTPATRTHGSEGQGRGNASLLPDCAKPPVPAGRIAGRRRRG